MDYNILTNNVKDRMRNHDYAYKHCILDGKPLYESKNKKIHKRLNWIITHLIPEIMDLYNGYTYYVDYCMGDESEFIIKELLIVDCEHFETIAKIRRLLDGIGITATMFQSKFIWDVITNNIYISPGNGVCSDETLWLFILSEILCNNKLLQWFYLI